MDAHALALSLAPCVAWHAPPQSERRRVSHFSTLETYGAVHGTVASRLQVVQEGACTVLAHRP